MAGTEGSKRLVLVVDDSEDNREVYAQYLRLSGFRVESAVDGVEAVEKAAALIPDVIVMDLAMPRLDGWEATRRIKACARDEQGSRHRAHGERGLRVPAPDPGGGLLPGT